jgi:hypothetical protein
MLTPAPGEDKHDRQYQDALDTVRDDLEKGGFGLLDQGALRTEGAADDWEGVGRGHDGQGGGASACYGKKIHSQEET